MKHAGSVFLSMGMILLICLSITPSTGQAGSFLKIDGITGESRDATHPGWIDVASYKWLTPVPSVRTGGTARGGAGSLVVSKRADTASTMLSTSAASKALLPLAIITYPSSSNPLEYLRITMKNVIITSFTVSGSGGEDRLTEDVTMNFGSVTVEYEPTGGIYSPSIGFTANTVK